MISATPFDVRVRGLARRFTKGGQSLEVLRGVDVDLPAGDRVAIRGQSGSGKSTFLQILGTLDKPTAGTVHFDDRDVFRRPAAELDALRNRSIGFIFQFHHLLPDHDALHNVMLPALIAGVDTSAAKAQSADLLKRVGLGDRLLHKPGELSGGEQQRVAIARALVRRPALVLADEPTGNLDPRRGREALALIRELCVEHGAALLLVSHDEGVLAQFDRVVQFSDLNTAACAQAEESA